MKIHTPTSFIKRKQTWLIIALAVILAAFVGLWVVAGLQHAAIAKNVDKEYSDAKAAAKLIAKDSSASRDKRLVAIKTLSTPREIQNCEGEWWNVWYGMVLPSAKQGVKDCETKAKHLLATAMAASRVNEYLEADVKVTKTLAVLKPATGSDTWQKTALSSAQSALRDIEAMAVTKDSKALLVVSKDKVLAITKAWGSLNEASSKEDKTAYLDAQSKLIQSYADLGAISDVSDKQVEELVGALQVEASKL